MAKEGEEVRGVKAIADALGVSDRTVARWLEDGGRGLPVKRIGGRWRGERGQLRAWYERDGGA